MLLLRVIIWQTQGGLGFVFLHSLSTIFVRESRGSVIKAQYQSQDEVNNLIRKDGWWDDCLLASSTQQFINLSTLYIEYKWTIASSNIIETSNRWIYATMAMKKPQKIFVFIPDDWHLDIEIIILNIIWFIFYFVRWLRLQFHLYPGVLKDL